MADIKISLNVFSIFSVSIVNACMAHSSRLVHVINQCAKENKYAGKEAKPWGKVTWFPNQLYYCPHLKKNIYMFPLSFK